MISLLLVHFLLTYNIYSYADANIKYNNFQCIYPINFYEGNKYDNFYIFVHLRTENNEGKITIRKLSIFAWNYRASTEVTNRDSRTNIGKNENLHFAKRHLRNIINNENDYRNLSTSYELTNIQNIAKGDDYKLPIYNANITIKAGNPQQDNSLAYIHFPLKLDQKETDLFLNFKTSNVEKKLISVKIMEVDNFEQNAINKKQFVYMNCLSFISLQDFNEFYRILTNVTRSNVPKLNKKENQKYKKGKLIHLKRIYKLQTFEGLIEYYERPNIHFYRFKLKNDIESYFENKAEGEIEVFNDKVQEENSIDEIEEVDLSIHVHRKEPLGVNLRILIIFGVTSALICGGIILEHMLYSLRKN
eukprot:GAHX01002143.1.p1 GENE.GAHX01002143.1~~GAHX01002143.1.p1  ORF type:complete len:360 (-),score=75.46 GAHX01002143.1:334-1413(-)